MSWSVRAGREGPVSSWGPVGLEVQASRSTSQEDGAGLERRWARWRATLAKARAVAGQRGLALRRPRRHAPVVGQLVALAEVGVVVRPQGSLRLAVTAGHFLHLAVGAEQALLAGPGLGPTATEGGEEPVAPPAQVGGEEGVQLLPAERGRRCPA